MSVCLTVYEIFSVKEWRDLENGGRSRSRSLKMAPFDRSYTIFYLSAILSIAVCCTIFKLFDVEWSWPWKGHWRSFKLVPFESLGAVSVTSYQFTHALLQCHFEWSWVTWCDLAKYSMARSVERSLCDSCASCFISPCIRRPRSGGSHRNIAIPFGTEKLEWCCYPRWKKLWGYV